VNEPPNVLYPAEFARRAKAQLSRLGVKVEILGEAEMKKQGFGALLGVGQGSARESQLVVMQWNGGPSSKNKKSGKPIALVGKACVSIRAVFPSRSAPACRHEGRHGGRGLCHRHHAGAGDTQARVNAVG